MHKEGQEGRAVSDERENRFLGYLKGSKLKLGQGTPNLLGEVGKAILGWDKEAVSFRNPL